MSEFKNFQESDKPSKRPKSSPLDGLTPKSKMFKELSNIERDKVKKNLFEGKFNKF